MNPVIDTPEVFEPLLAQARYKGAYGGRGCCHPDTLIDTPSGQVKISEFEGGKVYSFLNGRIVEADATPSASYTKEQLYLVTLEDGREISVTDQHRFLTRRGWVQCCDLSMCDEVFVSHLLDASCLHRSNQDIDRIKSLEDDRHYFGIHADYQDDYSLCPRQYDLQLQFLTRIGLISPPSQGDVLLHNHHVLMHTDGQEYGNTDILSILLSRLSTLYALLELVGKYFARMGIYIFERISELLLEFYQLFPLFQQNNNLVSQDSGLSQPPVYSDILKNQDESQQKQMCKPKNVYHDDSLYAPSCYHDLPILTRIKSICKHDRLIYWDLHVPGLNNYLSNGIVNHNSGKSHFMADSWLDESIRQKLDFVCLRETLKSLEFSVKKLLESKIVQHNAGAYFDVQDRRIMSKRGGVTIFEGMQNHTADSIKSLEGFDRAWFEEAQNASEKSLTLLRPTIRKPESELWFTWNPERETDPIDLLLRGVQPPTDSIVVRANYMDNPFFPDVLREEMEYDKRRDPDKYAHVWLGEYQRNSESRVFKNWKVEEFTRPEGTIYRFGADWGFAVDPSVLVRSSIEGNRLYIDYEAYAIGCEIVNLPELFFSIPEAEKWPIIADSARPETISHMVKNGFPKIRAAIKGPKSIEDGIEFLKSFDIVVHPRCKHTIDELTLYSYKIDKLTEEVLPILDDKFNHVIDALRYSCEGSRRAIKAKKTETKSDVHNQWNHSQGWMA